VLPPGGAVVDGGTTTGWDPYCASAGVPSCAAALPASHNNPPIEHRMSSPRSEVGKPEWRRGRALDSGICRSVPHCLDCKPERPGDPTAVGQQAARVRSSARGSPTSPLSRRASGTAPRGRTAARYPGLG